jgi:hypothetical protein
MTNDNDDLDEEIRRRDEAQETEAALLKGVAEGKEASIIAYAASFQDELRAYRDANIDLCRKLEDENQTAWFMLRQAFQRNKIKIRLIEKSIKTKRAKEAEERAAKKAAGPSPAELKRLAKEKNDLRAMLWSQCGDIAKSPTLMDDFVRVAQRDGIVEEAHAIRSTYLAATSRLAIKNVINVVREGAAAGGKSFVTDSVLDFIPKESVIELTTASPMALIYMGGDDDDFLKHKILNIAEAVVVAEKKDGSEPNPFATMLRTHLSKGFISHQVAVPQKRGPTVTMTFVRNGPTVAMMTTARDNIDDELRTRLISTQADETRGQTIKIIKRTFSANIDTLTSEERAAWLAFQRWLALGGPYEVAIPFINAIGDSFESRANCSGEAKEYPLRARRDSTALKAAIGASAILHKAQRDVDEDGRIVATIDDYRLAHDVIDPSTAEAHHIVIPKTALAVIEAMEKLGVNKHIATKVTVRALREKIGVSSTSTAAARLYETIDAGLIEIAEHPDGRPYLEHGPRYYKLLANSEETKALINAGRVLRVFPTADEIAQIILGGGRGAKEQQTAEQKPEAQPHEQPGSKEENEVEQSVASSNSPQASASPAPPWREQENEQAPEQAVLRPSLFGLRPSLFGEQAQEPPLFGDEAPIGAPSPTSTTPGQPSEKHGTPKSSTRITEI